MKTLNIVAIRNSGMTITDQVRAELIQDAEVLAAKKVLYWLNDWRFPTGSSSSDKIVRVFFGTQDNGLMEFSLNDIKELAQI